MFFICRLDHKLQLALYRALHTFSMAIPRTCHGKMDPPPPKLVPPGINFLINKDPPGTYFPAKYGLPLKNLDHLPEMK